MKTQLPLNRQVFLKDEFYNTINTNFSELVNVVPNVVFDINQATVGDFFELYNKIFFEIPKEGTTNSHEFLVRESGEYINFSQNNEEIQALLEEINILRQENLNLINTINDLSTQFSKFVSSKTE
jgi:hypothetical protein